MARRRISIVVPCYRDEPNIRELYRRVRKTMEATSYDWEVVYVNDGSPDNSHLILSELTATEPNLTVVTLSRNFGVMSAFHAGMNEASGDAVVIMDGDLQDPPEVIPEFISQWESGYLVVFGCRSGRIESRFRRLGYKVFYRIWETLADTPVAVDAGEYALIDRRVVDIVRELPEKDRFLRGLRGWAGFPQIGVEYERPGRYAGETTQSLASYLVWSARAITSFSVKPLRFVSMMAFGSCILMVALLVFMVATYLLGVDAPHGFFTIIFVVLFAATAQIFSMAIIAEYLVGIFQEVKGRPSYVVQSIERSDGGSTASD